MKWIAILATSLLLAACGYQTGAAEYRQVTVQPTGVVRTVPLANVTMGMGIVPAASESYINDPVDLSSDFNIPDTTFGYY